MKKAPDLLQCLLVAGAGLEPTSALGGYEPDELNHRSKVFRIHSLPFPPFNSFSLLMASIFVSNSSEWITLHGLNFTDHPFCPNSLCERSL